MGKIESPIVALKRKTSLDEADPLAKVAFRAWTEDGKLRHASFKGLREPEDEASILKLV